MFFYEPNKQKEKTSIFCQEQKTICKHVRVSVFECVFLFLNDIQNNRWTFLGNIQGKKCLLVFFCFTFADCVTNQAGQVCNRIEYSKGIFQLPQEWINEVNFKLRTAPNIRNIAVHTIHQTVKSILTKLFLTDLWPNLSPNPHSRYKWVLCRKKYQHMVQLSFNAVDKSVGQINRKKTGKLI